MSQDVDSRPRTDERPIRDYNPFVEPDLSDPYTPLAEARKNAPVFYSPAMGAWVVTRHEDVKYVLAETELFSSTQSIYSNLDPLPEPVAEILRTGFPYSGGLVDMDPPDHAPARRLFNHRFVLSSVTRLQAHIRAQAHRLVDEMGGPPADIGAAFANMLPVVVITTLLGVPSGDVAAVKFWADEWLVLNSRQGDIERLTAAARALLDFQSYVDELLAQRETGGMTDDPLSDLLAINDTGVRPIDRTTMHSVLMSVLLAGYKTTSGLLANSVYQLSRRPEVVEELQRSPELIDKFLLEVVRFDTAVPGMYRTATQDVQIGGTVVPAGSHLQVSFLSADRDETVFDHADRFDLHRTDGAAQIGFGRGIHHCMGSSLSMLEAHIAVETVIDRLPGLRLADGCERVFAQSATIRNTPSLMVTWRK
ncbi:cytochrome P450 [Kribbella sp. NPDC004536]|uniref:cytochrome P450 n=1 Tax=Kribbella sp. NPDC004536 TaxID=3364106 RepID=UPI00369928A9